LPFKIILPKEGKGYEKNIEFEKQTKGALYIVKNTDDNCLYAALFLAHALLFNEITISSELYKFNDNTF